MRVLITVPSYHPSIFGGIAVCMHQIIPEVARKADISVLTTSYKIPLESNILFNEWISKDEHIIMYVKTRNPLFSWKYLITGIREVMKTDRVYLNSLFFFPNLILCFFARLCRKKTFWSTHGELSNSALDIKSGKKRIYLFLLKLIAHKVIFIATSGQEHDQIKAVFRKNRVIIIPNFFEIDKARNVPKKNQFLFLGRISPIKKIENLISGFSESASFTVPGAGDYSLVIAGENDAEYRQYLDNLRRLVFDVGLERKISFIGSVSSPDKEVLIAESKALCLVSASENFGNVVAEALIQGTPVIASHGTPWAGLNERNSGFWIENSPESIAKAVNAIIEMPDEDYRKMCANAELMADEYSKAKIIPLWNVLFE